VLLTHVSVQQSQSKRQPWPSGVHIFDPLLVADVAASVLDAVALTDDVCAAVALALTLPDCAVEPLADPEPLPCPLPLPFEPEPGPPLDTCAPAPPAPPVLVNRSSASAEQAATARARTLTGSDKARIAEILPSRSSRRRAHPSSKALRAGSAIPRNRLRALERDAGETSRISRGTRAARALPRARARSSRTRRLS